MKSFEFKRLFVLLFLVPTVSSLIISSVYAGKKKFKTFSFGTPLLPTIVKVEPNKLHLTFRQYKYLRTPQFKIEGTLPLKAPTIIKEVFKPDPNPEVVEYNFGDMGAIPEANQHVTYDDTQNVPVFVEPPKETTPQMPSPSGWQPIVNRNPIEFTDHSNYFPTHHRVRRFANHYNNRFEANRMIPSFNGFPRNYESFETPHHYPIGPQNSDPYPSSTNYQNFFNPNVGPYPGNTNLENSAPIANSYPNFFTAQSHSPHQFKHHSYNSGSDMTASSSSFGPPKYERYFNPSNFQNNKWIPIDSPSVPPMTQSSDSGHSNGFVDQSQKKVNIGEHYNPSASYVNEKMVEKPTYDPDESEPDEGAISFSISGPHGGEEVPAGYEAKIKQMHEVLKEHPNHLPPGLDIHQLMRYYTHHTFTDPLKDSYGYKPAFGPLGFIKSKLKSWKNLL